MPYILVLNCFVRIIVIAVPVAVWRWWGLLGVFVVTSAIALYRSFGKPRQLPSELKKLLDELKADERVTETVARLSAAAGRQAPRAGVVDALGGDKFQAEAVGRPAPGFVFITRPFMERLTDEELTAVLAHELAHIWHPLKGRRAIIAVWGLVAGGMIELGYAVALFGPHLRAEKFLYALWLLLFLLVVAPFLSVLLPAMISRRVEAEADAWACRMGCDGLCLATALWEVESQDVKSSVLSDEGAAAPRLLDRMREILRTKGGRRGWTAMRRRDALMSLCRCDVVAEGLITRLLSNHPSTARRTQQMLDLSVARPDPSARTSVLEPPDSAGAAEERPADAVG